MDLTVLLIESDVAHAQHVRRFLSQSRPRWRVVHSPSLADAHQQCKSSLPRVALIALELVDGSALDALPWVHGTIALVMVRAGQESMAALALRAGFDDFMVRAAMAQGVSHLQTLPEQMERLAQQRAQHEALQADIQILHDTLSSISHGVLSLDAKGRVQASNPRAAELMELPDAMLQSKPLLSEIVEYQRLRGEFGDGKLYWPADTHLASYGGGQCPAVYIRRKLNGRYLEVRTHCERDGRRVRTYTDVTEYVTIQEKLRQSEQRWRNINALSSDWFWELDSNGCFVLLDDCPQRLQEVLHGQRFDAAHLWHTATPPSQAVQRPSLLQQQPFQNWEMCHTSATEGTIWLQLSGIPTLDAAGNFTSYCGVARDITERKRADAEIHRLAYTDDLTELPNRAAMRQHIERGIARSMERGAGALLMLDINRFKDINDGMGHRWGDALLREVAQRLQLWCRPGDLVGRVGGDEFLLMVQGIAPGLTEAKARAGAMAVSLLGILAQPFSLQGREVPVSFSVGVAAFHGCEQGLDAMHQRVELALEDAKKPENPSWSMFDPKLQQKMRERAVMEAEIRQALELGQFILHYQPIVDAEGCIHGAEALVRWQHPERGLVMPGQFIALAEQLGLIYALDRWVLRLACQQLAVWAQSSATAHWSLAVNLSAQEFRHSDFVARIEQTLRETGARADRLKLELTESLMLDEVEESIAKMQSLRNRGIKFSLDDFGTGYSSLSYLKRLPLSQLKIDQSFVHDVLIDANDASIVRTVITLGQSLGLEVVAEGVETEGQRDFLVTHGCQRFQGYLFGKPMPASELCAQRYQPRTASAQSFVI